MKKFVEILKEKIIVFDGAMGTNIQARNLNPDDFGGERYNGCNEYLVISKSSVIESIHSDFLSAGCDVIETNTFGASPIVLSEFGLADKSYEINYQAAKIAKKIADDYSTNGLQRFVAGSIGPTTKLPSLGHISFRELEKAFYLQAQGLTDGGADIIVIETCQDILQTKAALAGIIEYFKHTKKKLPVVVSLTIEKNGTMLLGTEISAALTTLQSFEIDALGLNCATGPAEMSDHLRYLKSASPFPIFCMPNAGMPENIGGIAHYHLSPKDCAKHLSHFVEELGVNIIGGCCGTTTDHIKRLVDEVGSRSPVSRVSNFIPSVSSLYQSVPLHIEPAPILIGERTNANGSKLFKDLLLKNDFDGMVAVGETQIKEGAHILDLSVAYTGRNEIEDMDEIVNRFNTQITAPLMIDSTDLNAIESALQRYGGKAIINSVNLEDGEERLSIGANLCKKFGCALIALTIDENGMAKSAERKLEIASRIHSLVVEKYGISEDNLIFDTLTFTLGSGDDEFRNSGVETLNAIKLVKAKFPNVKTSLGISNVSFGLIPESRIVLNSIFLHYAIENGLDMAIVHASKILPLYKIKKEEFDICRKLIFNDKSKGNDPLKEFIEYFAKIDRQEEEELITELKSVEDMLKYCIIEGNKKYLEGNLKTAIQQHKPIDIINNMLLEGMKTVGELFGAGKMQLPFVLRSAEVMKSAVTFLEQFMEKTSIDKKGILVLATVRGDVHDIGKNLVDIILSNNGYRVINLGIRVPVETIIQSAIDNTADAIGMSGLLVKSTAIMKENLEIMSERNITIPVVLGGAALTRRFVEEDLSSVYNGPVSYACDVFDGLKFMENLSEIKKTTKGNLKRTKKKDKIITEKIESDNIHKDDIKIPEPPFWGSKVVENIKLDDVFEFINETALIKGQWQIYKGDKSNEDYKKYIESEIYPVFEHLKSEIKNEKLLEPKVIYGYFPCQSEGNNLIVYKPENLNEIHDVWSFKNNDLNQVTANKNAKLSKWIQFTFPRQSSDRNLCISDYFVAKNSNKFDVLAVMIVTVGKKATEYLKSLLDSDQYQKYLLYHGLSVESTEALAEMWHSKIRKDLNIYYKDAPDIKKLFKQGYQGSRYSFGYSACPDLEDQVKIFELLHPERIEIELTEEFQMVPEQSTSAIIVHHPGAKYFVV